MVNIVGVKTVTKDLNCCFHPHSQTKGKWSGCWIVHFTPNHKAIWFPSMVSVMKNGWKQEKIFEVFCFQKLDLVKWKIQMSVSTLQTMCFVPLNVDFFLMGMQDKKYLVNVVTMCENKKDSRSRMQTCSLKLVTAVHVLASFTVEEPSLVLSLLICVVGIHVPWCLVVLGTTDGGMPPTEVRAEELTVDDNSYRCLGYSTWKCQIQFWTQTKFNSGAKLNSTLCPPLELNKLPPSQFPCCWKFLIFGTSEWLLGTGLSCRPGQLTDDVNTDCTAMETCSQLWHHQHAAFSLAHSNAATASSLHCQGCSFQFVALIFCLDYKKKKLNVLEKANQQ